MTDNRDALVALAERCEAAAGPDRELDADITRIVQDRLVVGICSGMMLGRFGFSRECPAYTGSLDAAMTLVPAGRLWTLYSNG